MQVKKLSSPGRYADGNCLYLTISESGSKSWLLRIVVRGRRRDMGLGSVDLISLEEARDLARQYRLIARSGGDPQLDRQALRGELISFREAAVQEHELNVPSWGNDKHASQWLSSLEIHVFPIIGSMPVSQIKSAVILKVLAPIWIEKADTAKKIRRRLRMLVKWAQAQGYFTGNETVELVEQALPKVNASGAHFRSVSYDDLPQIIDRFQDSSVSLATRLALEFLILTASRTTEVLEAHWSEIDLDKKLWVISADRMKASPDHEVPLTERTIEILQAAAKLKLDNGLMFPSSLNGVAMSNNTLRVALQKRSGVDATVHGMRSAFKDWAAETTTYPNEVSEMALAHSIGSKVEAAYRRGNLLTKRRQIMADWDAYLAGKGRKVIQLHETGDAR